MSDRRNYQSLGNENPLVKDKSKKKKKNKEVEYENIVSNASESDELLNSYQTRSDGMLGSNPMLLNPLIAPNKKRIYPPEMNLERVNSMPRTPKSPVITPDDPDHYLHPRHTKTALQALSIDEGSDDGIEDALSHNTVYGKPRRHQLNEVSPYCVAMYIGIFFCAVILSYGILAITQSFGCLGPPYLYITHKGSKNIMKFSRDGCLIHEKVLWGVSNENSDLRGMAFGNYHDKQVLYVADADSDMSGVIMFGECFESTSLRPFISRVVTAWTNPGAEHTYGIAVDYTGDIYASFQKSDTVLRFTPQTFQPIPNRKDLSPILYLDSNMTKYLQQLEKQEKKLQKDTKKKAGVSNNQTTAEIETSSSSRRRIKRRRALHTSRSLRSIEQPTYGELENISEYFSQRKYHLESWNYYNGTFVQFGLPNQQHEDTERGIRSIAWVKNYTELWIANEDLDSVIIVNRDGHLIGSINIKNPIGMYHPQEESEHNNLIFISSKQKKLGGVFAFDLESRLQVKAYQSIGMNHPTGMVSYHDVLFVSDQSRNAVITFNITTSRVIGLIIPSTKLHGDIEHITLSPC